VNIFYLDTDIKRCAAYHCDKHVVKMILEYAQLLSTTTHQLLGVGPYKPTHANHPCAIWTRKSEANFFYLVDLQEQLNLEYKKRYSGRDHKSYLVVRNELELPTFTSTEFTEPPKCVPDEYKHLDVVTAYREYYKKDKAYFCTWKTEVPSWFI
jgi:hypothetical protein